MIETADRFMDRSVDLDEGELEAFAIVQKERAKQARRDRLFAIWMSVFGKLDDGFEYPRWQAIPHRIKAVICLSLGFVFERFRVRDQKYYNHSTPLVWLRYQKLYAGWEGDYVVVASGWRHWWAYIEHDGDWYI